MVKHVSSIALMKWYCAAGRHTVFGGSRYANHNGEFDCAEHTPYLD